MPSEASHAADIVPLYWPENWSDPVRLELLRGTPVNCLVGRTRPRFPLGKLAFIPEGKAPPGVILREGKWPRVQAGSAGGDSVSAGPTGGPWVESNAGLIRLARALHPASTVWLTYPPPLPSEVVRFDQLPLPLAEAGAYGARWVIRLHASLQSGLERSEPEAVAAWKRMMAMLEFTDRHRDWWDWNPVAALAVVSTFSGGNEFLAREFVNLIPRKRLACRIIPEGDLEQADLAGLRAILYLEEKPPTGATAQRLLSFARGGGMLILPSQPAEAEGASRDRGGYRMQAYGKGSLFWPAQPWYDPYVLVTSIHTLIGRREDVVRIWNGGLLNAYCLAAPGGGRAVLQLIEYGRPRGYLADVTVGLAAKYRKATVRTLQGSERKTPERRRLGVEIPLPRFSVYAAVELEV